MCSFLKSFDVHLCGQESEEGGEGRDEGDEGEEGSDEEGISCYLFF